MKKTMTLLALLLGLVFSVNGTTILSENFSGCTTGTVASPADITATMNDYMQLSGWTGIQVYSANGLIKLGSSGTVGNLTTPTIDLSGNNGIARIEFDISRWATDASVGQVFLSTDGSTFNQVGSNIVLTSTSGTTMIHQSIDITGGTSNSKIKFTCTTKRIFIDNISITQTPIPTTLSGSYDVGSGKPYATLAAAITDLITKGVSGAVTLNLTDPVYNLGTTPLTIGSISGTSSTNTVTIKPAAGVTTSITGDVAGALIDLDGADFVTIDGLSGKLTINNTNIEGSAIAIKATSGYCTVTGTSITGNAKTGIEIYNAPHTSINKNKIFNLIGSGSNPLTGIYCEADETVAETNINNNMIILEGSTSSTLQGVQYYGTSDLSTLNLYNNSIYIGGMMQYTTNSFAFLKTGSAATINVKNNILYNKRVPLGIGKIPAAHQYAIVFRETSGNFTQDNNLFYSQEGVVGTYGFNVTSLLSDWQTASGLDANSQSSILTFEATAFANGELKYLRHADNAAIFNTGFNTGIATDFYGISRPQYGAYDIGAYELEASASLSETTLPTVNTLAQNYPNPFNPETTIGFTLAKNATVNLTVYNTRGEVVKSLINNSLNAGFHSVNFNAVGLNSGVYVYKLTTPDNSITKKMILLK